MARSLCCMGGQMIPSIRGPPLTLHHPNMLCPCPPSLFLPPAQDFCPTSSNTGPWAHKQKRQQWSPARPRVLSFPVRRSQISAPNSAEGPFQQPLVRCGAAPASECFGYCFTQSVLPQPHETLCFWGRQHQTQKGRFDLWAGLVSWP